MKLISVVIPIYNVETYLEKCIESVCGQSYANMEILLIDDGSTDNSARICDRFAGKDSRIKVVHQKNGGRSAARNRGLAEAQGDYLMFVDGDDWIDTECLQEACGALEKYQAQMTVFRSRNIYSGRIEDESTDEMCLLEGEEPLRFYVEGRDGFQNLTAVWGKLYVKELLEEVRFVENKYYEDVMFITQVFSRCTRCVYLNQAYYNYNIATANSITYLGVNELTFRDEIPILNEKEDYLKELGKTELAERFSFFKYQKLLQYYTDCVHAGQKEYAGRIADIIYADKKKVRRLLKREYASGYYKLFFRLFLIAPVWGYHFEEVMKKVYTKRDGRKL